MTADNFNLVLPDAADVSFALLRVVSDLPLPARSSLIVPVSATFTNTTAASARRLLASGACGGRATWTLECGGTRSYTRGIPYDGSNCGGGGGVYRDYGGEGGGGFSSAVATAGTIPF